MELHEIQSARNVLEGLCMMVECQRNLLSSVSLGNIKLVTTVNMCSLYIKKKRLT